MPRFARRRRPAARPRRIPRSTWMKKYRSRRIHRVPRNGGTFIVRKVKELASSSNGIAGGYAITTNNSVILGTPTAAPGGLNMYDVPFSVVGRLDELANFTELTGLFDQFKISFIKVKVQTAYTTGTGAVTPIPFIDYLADHDDGVPPVATSFRDRMGVKTRYFSSMRPAITMVCKPKVVVRGLLTAAGAQNTNLIPRPTWVNSAYPETEHYAIKGILRNVYLPAAANTSLLTWDVSLGVALKDVQ